MVKKPALYVDGGAAPRIHEAANVAAADNAMTGNEKGHAVCAAGCTDRARRRTHASGDFRIGAHAPRGNRPHGVPDLDLEVRSFIAEWEIESEPRVPQKGFELSASLAGESRLWLEQGRSAWKVIDAHYLLPGGPNGKYGERRRDLCLPGFQHGIHYLRTASIQPLCVKTGILCSTRTGNCSNAAGAQLLSPVGYTKRSCNPFANALAARK